MESKLCKVCKEPIPLARVEALPETEVCVNHSNEQPYRAFVEGSARHKGFEVVILKADDPAVAYYDDPYITGEMAGGAD